jgi:hypothetical protein
MTIIGRRTLLTCLVIVVLAVVQYCFKVKVPPEIWVALFAIAIAFLRAGLPVKAAGLMLCCLLFSAACITVNNYVGDSALLTAAAAAGDCELASTNRVFQMRGTNSAESVSGVRMRGGLIINTSVNKGVSPDTSTVLQYKQ